MIFFSLIFFSASCLFSNFLKASKIISGFLRMYSSIKTIGIDYSLSSPAICVCRGEFKLDNCKIYYLTNVKKYEGKFYNGQIDGRLHLPYTSEQQRHDQISEWALSVIGTAIGNIFIEVVSNIDSVCIWFELSIFNLIIYFSK